LPFHPTGGFEHADRVRFRRGLRRTEAASPSPEPRHTVAALAAARYRRPWGVDRWHRVWHTLLAVGLLRIIRLARWKGQVRSSISPQDPSVVLSTVFHPRVSRQGGRQ
jgi:hypothetical protein